ncbi:hypothetical protein M408DRAFT_124832 [Serendipita vermifera MAFF 305830]|uniref:Uncharacterized protein n=1 Tax=Serendipita vermifera MAFF 305830 TaxID=933852 RepID=A0A0C3AN24_SERVB|nr:hypothetical protein M408DRAFT_124832 [Serendipita vermifera MAFF 305830]
MCSGLCNWTACSGLDGSIHRGLKCMESKVECEQVLDDRTELLRDMYACIIKFYLFRTSEMSLERLWSTRVLLNRI